MLVSTFHVLLTAVHAFLILGESAFKNIKAFYALSAHNILQGSCDMNVLLCNVNDAGRRNWTLVTIGA